MSVPTIDRATNCFRIGVPQWLRDERFAELLDLFDRHRGATDEVTFFTSETHPPLPLATISDRATILAERMDAVRRRGWRTGINLLSTIGHHEENLAYSLSGQFQWMTAPDGGITRGVLCPNHGDSRAYIRDVYRLLAEARPDYIWIDDDVRLFGHSPILLGCFCDTCLAIFSDLNGRPWTRESLRAVANAETPGAKLALRHAWLAHNRATLERLFSLIEETVHAVQPGIALGFMTGERYYEGYDFATWARILAGADDAPVLWRPGGGQYTDERLDGIVGKAHEIGRQIANLPASVRVIESEIENFPYQRLKKSERAVALEAAAYIAAGCTGAAYNVLSMYDEPLAEYEPLVARLEKARPFLDLLARHIGRAPALGLHSGWTTDSYAAIELRTGDWFAPREPIPGAGQTNELHEIGIPAAYGLDEAPVVALVGSAPRAFDEKTLRRILSGGVYMDAAAARELAEMGFGDLLGFVVGEPFDRDAIEQLVAHPLNGEFAGRDRDGRQSFWRVTAHALVPAAGAQPLARLVDYARKEIALCGLGVFENRLGGRVCVAGYAPWTFLQNLAKSTQMKRIVRWLSRDGIPAYVDSFHRAIVWVREPEPGRHVVAILNASLDPARDVALMLRTNRADAVVSDMRLRETRITSSRADGPYLAFVVPEIAPWEMVLVTT